MSEINKKGLSVVILAHNEPEIFKALNSVKPIADQIILIDDNSPVPFRRLCKKIAPKAEIYRRKLDDFSAQKNFGISKSRYGWILNIDADEEVSPQLAEEIKSIVKNNPDVDAFRIPFTTLYFGKYLENHESHVRLFKNSGIKFRNAIHEKVDVKGKTDVLKESIIHHHWKGYSIWKKKLKRYAYEAALRDIRNGKDYSKMGILLRMLLIPLVNFLDGFILKRRYKLGFKGFQHSLIGGMNAKNRFAVYYDIKYNKPDIFKNELGKDKR